MDVIRRANRRIVLLVSTKQALRPDVVEEQRFSFEPAPEELGYTVEGTPVQGLGASARDQARLWLERMNAVIGDGAGTTEDGATLVSTLANDADPDALESEPGVVPEEASAAEGLNRVELDDGGLLFTGQ